MDLEIDLADALSSGLATPRGANEGGRPSFARAKVTRMPWPSELDSCSLAASCVWRSVVRVTGLNPRAVEMDRVREGANEIAVIGGQSEACDPWALQRLWAE